MSFLSLVPLVSYRSVCVDCLVDLPGGTDDREADAEGDAETSPGVGRYGLEKGANVERLATTGEEHVC